MKPLCPKCLTTHWEDQACKVKSLAELPAIFPSPPVEPSQIDDSFHNPFENTASDALEGLVAEMEALAADAKKVAGVPEIPQFTAKPKKTLSKAHLAALKAGREAKRDQAR